MIKCDCIAAFSIQAKVSIQELELIYFITRYFLTKNHSYQETACFCCSGGLGTPFLMRLGVSGRLAGLILTHAAHAFAAQSIHS